LASRAHTDTREQVVGVGSRRHAADVPRNAVADALAELLLVDEVAHGLITFRSSASPRCTSDATVPTRQPSAAAISASGIPS
jgi:hypothetical protein